jgi:flagellar basal-body rod protein FlgG
VPHFTGLRRGIALFVLVALGCSASSSTEMPSDSESAPPSEVASASSPQSIVRPVDPIEASRVPVLAKIAPCSPGDGVVPAIRPETRGIELVAVNEPIAGLPAPARIPPGLASTSRESVLPKESRRTLETAIGALEIKINVAIDNLANAQTPGFKRRRVILAPLAPRHDALAGVKDSSGNLSAVGIAVGQGCTVECIQTDFSQGSIVKTGRSLDLAIEGDGFFPVQRETGEIVYTRVANLNPNANGNLVIGSATSGNALDPPLMIPSDALEVAVSPEGDVSIRQPGVATLTAVGGLQLARFINNDGLRALGGGLFAETEASGSVTLATPGQQGLGRIRQGGLEASNVDSERECAELRESRAAISLFREILRPESVSRSP